MKIKSSCHRDILKVPVLDTGLHILRLLRLMPLLSYCRLGLCHGLLQFLLLSAADHTVRAGMELSGQWVLGSLTVVGLEVLGVLLVLDMLVVLDRSF